MAFYLFNPLSIVSCVGMSMGIFSNFFILLTIYFGLSGQLIFSTFSCAMASYLSLYPAMLCIPLGVLLSRANKVIYLFFCRSSILFSHKFQTSMTKSIILSLVFTILFSASLLLVSFYLMNSWDFLSNCYEFILLAPDLQPNIGLFWYIIFTYFFYLDDKGN